jgi:ABC-2 type transport system permease protein
VGSRLAIYRRLLVAQVRGALSYRVSFALDLLGNGTIPAIDVLTILTIFRVARTLGGFDTVEVLLMYGIGMVGFALADLAVGNVERLREYVRRGLLDAVLVRPLSVLGQLLALDFTIRRVARVVVAGIVLGIAVSRVHLAWTPGHVALLLVAPLAAAVFYSAFFVGTATVAFWWIDSGEFANGFTYGGRDFASYPITVYSGAFRGLFAFALGFAFVSYYPAVALLGRPDPLGLPSWVAWCSPLVALAAVGVAALLWRSGVRHYRSTGS